MIKTNAMLSVLLMLALTFTSQADDKKTSQSATKVGVLVMAHGGKDEWNAGIEAAVAPLRKYCPVEIAFGMANPQALQDAVSRLEERGVGRIAVARLFISGESFLHQTEYLLGLRPDPPARFILMHHGPADSTANPHHGHGENKKDPDPITKTAELVINQQGLSDGAEMGEILVQRVKEQSLDAEQESVLILAHGAASDEENRRWLQKMNELVEPVRRMGPFRDVRVETLREDWDDKRQLAEERIRNFVQKGNENEGRVIVVPFRVFGFGPYAKVLDGLEYQSNGRGLLPHPLVAEWLKGQSAVIVQQAGWDNPFQTELSQNE